MCSNKVCFVIYIGITDRTSNSGHSMTNDDWFVFLGISLNKLNFKWTHQSSFGFSSINSFLNWNIAIEKIKYFMNNRIHFVNYIRKNFIQIVWIKATSYHKCFLSFMSLLQWLIQNVLNNLTNQSSKAFAYWQDDNMIKILATSHTQC